MDSTMEMLRINADRLTQSLSELGKIGEGPTGMVRTAFSPHELEARKFTRGLMVAAGLAIRVDAGGNLIGSRSGSDESKKPIVMGSHIDTVPSGGKYDGALGVMGAIEVCHTLQDKNVQTAHPLEVIAFTNEEGAFLNRGLLGSRAMCGLLEKADLDARDKNGKGYVDHLPSVSGDGSKLDRDIRKKGDLAGYLELHIEQGPYLIKSGNLIGVCTGITGRACYELAIRGFWNHAGTTPMDARKDALAAAARVILAVEAIAKDEKRTRVSTAGIIHCRPGAINVIPGEVDLELEFRDLEMGRMADAEKRLREVCEQISSETGVEIGITRVELEQSSPTHATYRGWIESVAGELGLTTEMVTSGAGHDAQAIAHITDIGMIFVPSRGGISHSPDEYSSPEDCANGTNVLLNVLLRADRELP